MSTLTTEDGVDIHYEAAGNGQAVLLIHGLGSSGLDWEYQIDALARHYRVITLDLRGHGRSSIPRRGYTMEHFAADARAVLDALGVDAAHVVGISMGGGVAFQLAIDSPQRVTSLTIINSGPSTRLPGLKLKLAVLLRKLMARWMSPARMAPRIAARLFPDPAMAAKREIFAERLAKNDRDAYRQSLHAFLGWCVKDRIGGLRMPTLFIAADQDYTPVALKQEAVDQMPNARLHVVSGAHHALPVEHPERFNALLLGFLAQRLGSQV